VANKNPFFCPFCGKTGKRSKEHVWAQWLHQTEGAKFLLDGTHGERIAMPGAVLRKGDDGRYQTTWESRGKYAKWLPNVTVWVCAVCNSGWMSQLESQAKDILEPFVLGGGTLLTLSKDDLFTLATWATKSWMAYALTKPVQSNPFTVEEYRAMAVEPQPLERAEVWLLHATEQRSHVGMGIASALIGKGAPQDLATRDNAAHGYLAVAGVVFFLVLVPPHGPEAVAKYFAPQEALSGSGVRRIWPGMRKQYFPLDRVPDAQFAALLDFPEQWANAMGLPTAGLTDADAVTTFQEFLDGADPAELRRRWEDVITRRCVFCGNTPVTQEHIWPRWLIAELPLPPRAERDERQRDVVIRTELDRAWEEYRGYTPDQRDSTVTVVCDPCIHGWMSEVEVSAAPLLRDLIAGTAATFDAKALAALERWALKTAMLLEYTDPHSVVASEAMYAAVRTDQPVPGALVMIGNRGAYGDVLDFSHLGLAIHTDDREFPVPSDAPHTYAKTSIALGPFVLLVFFATGEPLLAQAMLESVPATYGDVLEPVDDLVGRHWPLPTMSGEDYEDAKGGMSIG
jgi:hypothetical protein